MSGTLRGPKEFLHAEPFDASLTPGARNAVEHCLRVQPDEKVTLITDLACAEIGAAMARELESLNLRYNAWILEDLAPRPLKDMPAEVLDDLESSQVSIFAVKAQKNELHTRMQMTDVVNRRKIRHAHMVNIDHRIMLEGMRADFTEVDRISTQVWRMASAAKEVRATTPAGTDIVGGFSPQLKWIKTSGIITPNKWGNLPGGETFTCPERVDGTFVIDGVVGDYLCEKYGDLRDTPLTIEIRDTRLRAAYSANKELEDEFWRYCSYRRKQRPRGRVRHRHQHCRARRDRQHLAGRKNPRRSHCVRQSLRRAHRRHLVLRDAYRRGGPQVRCVDRRPSDHA